MVVVTPVAVKTNSPEPLVTSTASPLTRIESSAKSPVTLSTLNLYSVPTTVGTERKTNSFGPLAIHSRIFYSIFEEVRLENVH